MADSPPAVPPPLEPESSEFVITDCSTETVVVFLDRAEVSRSLQTRVKKGENEIKIKGLSECVDKDSIRVEGRGPATIAEVAYQTKYLTPEEQGNTQEKESELRKKLNNAEKVREALEAKHVRLMKQRAVLDGFADTAMKGTAVKGSDNETYASYLSKDNLVGMTAFLELFDRQASRTDEALHTLHSEQADNQKLIESLEANLRELNSYGVSKESRELVILLEAVEDAEVTLTLSYVVFRASWTPKYDIRVFSDEHQLKIQYYGVIQQSTGEDWNEVKLCLSTATPSVGGLVPTLGTQKLAFKQKQIMMSWESNQVRSAVMHSPRKMVAMSCRMGEGAPPPPPAPLCAPMAVMTSEVKESITSTMYEIARRSTIPCDNVGHKVTVAILDLVPAFEYQSVPKMASSAFLKAKVKNTSPYALLSGPSNIFLDNNFIAKSSLNAVSPGEEFNCSLGVDPGIKIDYKPLNKFREQSGLISKTISMTYKQVIEVKNNRKEAIKLHLSDQLPLSTEEKIKVQLVEPQIKHPEKYDPSKPIRLNASNNVEWDLDVAATETKEIILKYTIDYPANEEIETENINSNSSFC